MKFGWCESGTLDLWGNATGSRATGAEKDPVAFRDFKQLGRYPRPHGVLSLGHYLELHKAWQGLRALAVLVEGAGEPSAKCIKASEWCSWQSTAQFLIASYNAVVYRNGSPGKLRGRGRGRTREVARNLRQKTRRVGCARCWRRFARASSEGVPGEGARNADARCDIRSPWETVGVRRKVKAVVGGTPVTEDYAVRIGADGWLRMPYMRSSRPGAFPVWRDEFSLSGTLGRFVLS